MQKVTPEDIEACMDLNHIYRYVADILNHEYDVDTARNDVLSLVGGKYDDRIIDIIDADLNTADWD